MLPYPRSFHGQGLNYNPVLRFSQVSLYLLIYIRLQRGLFKKFLPEGCTWPGIFRQDRGYILTRYIYIVSNYHCKYAAYPFTNFTFNPGSHRFYRDLLPVIIKYPVPSPLLFRFTNCAFLLFYTFFNELLNIFNKLPKKFIVVKNF